MFMPLSTAKGSGTHPGGLTVEGGQGRLGCAYPLLLVLGFQLSPYYEHLYQRHWGWRWGVGRLCSSGAPSQPWG